MAPMLPPSHRYYGACCGRWSATFDFALTDRAAFWATSMSLLDRARLLSIASLPKILGPFRFDTTLAFPSGREGDCALHTTRVSKFGVTLLSSVETIALDADGRGFLFSGGMRLFPLPFLERSFGQWPGSVNEEGTQASYRFAWFGTEMQQLAELSADGQTVTLTQQTPFSRSSARLRRA